MLRYAYRELCYIQYIVQTNAVSYILLHTPTHAYIYIYIYIYKVRINYRKILQNHIFTNTEQKHMMLLPFERGMFAVP